MTACATRVSARPPLRLLQLTGFVSTLDRFAMAPLLVAIARDLGVPLADVVQAAGAYFLAYGLAQPVWGVVSDRLGLVRTMRLTLVLGGTASMISALAGSTLELTISRAVAGAFFAAAYPSCLIYLGDTVESRTRQGQIARLMVGIAVGTALASLSAGVLAGYASWRLAFALTGAMALCVSVSLRQLPEPLHSRRGRGLVAPFRRVLRSGTTLLILVLALVEGAGVMGALTLVPTALESNGSTAGVAGLVASAYGISVLVTARIVQALSRWWEPAWLIAIGASAGTGACAQLALSRTPGAGVLAAACLGLAWTSMHSSLQTWATDVLPDDRATVVSCFAGSLFTGSAVAAVVVSDLVDAGRFGVVFSLAAGLCLFLAVAGTGARWGLRTIPVRGRSSGG